MKKAFGVLAVVGAIGLLGGCGETKSKQDCSTEGEAFFTKSLDAYFAAHPQANGDNSYVLQPGANYDKTNNWWIVPFDYGGKKSQALLSCDGRLEISLR